MYAVIANGGKQYKVTEGQTLKLEKLALDAGDKFEIDQVLLLADGDNITLGTPFLKNVKVKAEIVGHGRGEKVHIIKFRRRKHHMKQMGHRQDYTEIKIVGIETSKKAQKSSSEHPTEE
jgi:large subunit ribosomal protein L21